MDDRNERDQLLARPWKMRVAQAGSRMRADLSFALVDALIVASAYMAALFLRFIDVQNIPSQWLTGFLVAFPFTMGTHLLANFAFGAYGHVWEYASVEEAMRLVFAALTSGVVLLAGLLTYREVTGGRDGLIPIMVLAVGAGLSLAGMGLVRFRSRLFSFKRAGDNPEPMSTLVVGTGRAAADLARHGAQKAEGIRVIGFVSPTTDGLDGRQLAGLPVIGGLSDVPGIVQILDVDQVVVAAPLSDDELREMVDGCMTIDVRLRIMPDLNDVLGAKGSLRDVRDLELADLLPRETVDIDLAEVADLLAGKRILVTGAGGSIGSEIVRQVLGFAPAEVVALDNDETHLYDGSLSWLGADLTATPVLCDIRDESALRRVFETHGPQVVFHAAAHKHVPILEAHPDEALKTNVGGTAHLLRAVKDFGAERFVLISTDKAVDPTSVMGASKRIAEMLVQATGSDGENGCVHSAVRFGNVLGSRGSVVPTFMRQIQAGGPVTVSDPEMLRYFMMVSEAVQLVLQAATMARGGEVFVLDMGEPIRIGDLAHRMIRLAGLVPGRDIEVTVTGMRPGEKRVEVLSRRDLESSDHPKVNIATPDLPEPIVLFDSLQHLEQLAASGDRMGLKAAIHRLAWRDARSDRVVDLREFSERSTQSSEMGS